MKTAIKKESADTIEENVKIANIKLDKALASGIIKKNKSAIEKSYIAKKLNVK